MEFLFQTFSNQQLLGFALGPFKGNTDLADRAVPVANLAEFFLQSTCFLDAVLGLGGAGLGATSQPFGFPAHPVGQPFFEILPLEEEVRSFFKEIGIGTPNLERTLGVDRRQFDYPVDGVLEKSPVMADHEDCGRTFGQGGVAGGFPARVCLRCPGGWWVRP